MKHRTLSDEQYLNNRKQFSEKYFADNLWATMDHWPLYCGIGNLARFMAIADIFRSTLDIPGHVAEFGSWKGANLVFLAKLLRIFNPQGSKIAHGFDTFEGLTAFSEKDGKAEKFKGYYKGSPEELEDVINLYQLTDEICLHKGLIEETLPRFLNENPSANFSFVYCDTDLCESTRIILKMMHPRLMKGGVFVFDEWNSESFPGEGIAANEFLREFGDFYRTESIFHARQPTLLIRKITHQAGL